MDRFHLVVSQAVQFFLTDSIFLQESSETCVSSEYR
jgi:hypothetical protein